MTANDWIQLVLVFCGACGAGQAAGLRTWPASTRASRAGWTARSAGWSAASIASPASIRSEEMGWRKYAVAVLLFNAVGFLAVYVLLRLQGVLPLNPQEFPANTPDSGVQHGRQLRHEHELAELRRRDDDELPVADARPDGAELRLGGVRHGRAGGADSRIGAAQRDDDRQFLVRPGAVDRLHPVAAVDRCGACAGVARRDSELQAVRDGERAAADDRRRTARSVDDADAGDGAGGVADCDQAAGHQRRRVLQRQLGASVRKSDAAGEFRRAAVRFC